MMEMISKEEVDRIIADNAVNEFYKLRGVAGFCFEPWSWEEAKIFCLEASYGELYLRTMVQSVESC